jgi:hypothetical protein
MAKKSCGNGSGNLLSSTPAIVQPPFNPERHHWIDSSIQAGIVAHAQHLGNPTLMVEHGAANSNIPVVLEHHAPAGPNFCEESAKPPFQYRRFME